MDGRKRKIAGAVVLVIVLAGVGVRWGLARDTGGVELLEASGTVEATEADLGFQAPGRVAVIVPREGDVVAAGEELASLDATGPKAARNAAKAQVAEAEARLLELTRGARPEEVRQAEAALRVAEEREEEARREAERAGRLFEGGAISRQARDRALTAYEVAAAERQRAEDALAVVRLGPRAETVEAQRARVEQARAQLARAEAALDDGVIRAPFAGRVTLRHREPGETVAPGAPVLTLLDPEDRWVRIYVPGDRIGRVSLGQRARIRSDSHPDKTYEGEVVFIGSEAEFTPRNVQTPEERTSLVYPVKVRIAGDPTFELKPGIPADVVLEGG